MTCGFCFGRAPIRAPMSMGAEVVVNQAVVKDALARESYK